jgi:hypothetical protein
MLLRLRLAVLVSEPFLDERESLLPGLILDWAQLTLWLAHCPGDSLSRR